MSGEPLGKVLLRNALRQVLAHNKILEQKQMWRMKDLERQNERKRRHQSFDLNSWSHSHDGDLHYGDCEADSDMEKIRRKDNGEEKSQRKDYKRHRSHHRKKSKKSHKKEKKEKKKDKKKESKDEKKKEKKEKKRVEDRTRSAFPGKEY